MKISVIVPFYNEEKHLPRCIQSLTSQTLPKSYYELIFIDNKSTDNSKTIVKNHPQIKLLYEHKPNAYLARNKAIQIATGNILAFTDADCAPTPNWLESIYTHISSHPFSIVTSDRHFNTPHSSNLKLLEIFENFKTKTTITHSSRQLHSAPTNNLAAHKRVFVEFGLFADLPLSGDIEFVQRVLQRSPIYSLHYLPNCSITHLEITNTSHWLTKYFHYGFGKNSSPSHTSINIPTNYSNFQAYRQLCLAENLSAVSQIKLIYLLILKSLFYKSGQIFGSFYYNSHQLTHKLS